VHVAFERATGRGEPHLPAARVVRVGLAGEVAVPLQVADQLVHRLLGHAGMRRELRGRRALDAVEPEDLHVRLAQLGVLRRNVREDGCQGLVERDAQQAEPAAGLVG
jgi:hypothetical protein